MNLKLNWIGIHVVDFEASLRFYTEVLGMNASDTKPDWAYIETTGMVFELFGGGIALPDSSRWGQGQAIRPSIQVENLRETVAELRQRGVQFAREIEQTTVGETIEFIAPEHMRWTLVHAPSYPFSTKLNQPHIGWLELKVDSLAEQINFYEILGLRPENGNDGQVILRQSPGEPFLLLESGGQRANLFQVKGNMLQPLPSHLISVETDNIEEAATWLRSHKVPILTEITHKSWGGIDLYIADMDGNPIQVVQYVRL